MANAKGLRSPARRGYVDSNSTISTHSKTGCITRVLLEPSYKTSVVESFYTSVPTLSLARPIAVIAETGYLGVMGSTPVMSALDADYTGGLGSSPNLWV